jgi:hypothetical protein
VPSRLFGRQGIPHNTLHTRRDSALMQRADSTLVDSRRNVQIAGADNNSKTRGNGSSLNEYHAGATMMMERVALRSGNPPEW